MKKLLSKKNGFTLVEILVAFVIFAIMSAMVMSVVQVAISARNANNQFARELAHQEEDLVRKDKTYKYDSTDTTLPAGTMNFNFQNEDGDPAGTASFGYQAHSTDDTKFADNLYEGLNYFIGDVEYTDKPIKDDDNKYNSASQAGRYDTRITGTKGFMYVRVVKAEKDSTYSGTGVRYLFETAVIPDTTDSISLKFAQYKLYFKDTDASKATTQNVTRDDGKEYTIQIPKSASILSAGYVNSVSLDPAKCSTTRENSINAYKLTVLRNGGVQIGYDFAKGDSCRDFSENTGFSRFYVVFSEDPNLTTADFGSNGVSTGSSHKYETFTDADGNVQPNIYGAYDYVYTPV